MAVVEGKHWAEWQQADVTRCHHCLWTDMCCVAAQSESRKWEQKVGVESLLERPADFKLTAVWTWAIQGEVAGDMSRGRGSDLVSCVVYTICWKQSFTFMLATCIYANSSMPNGLGKHKSLLIVGYIPQFGGFCYFSTTLKAEVCAFPIQGVGPSAARYGPFTGRGQQGTEIGSPQK